MTLEPELTQAQWDACWEIGASAARTHLAETDAEIVWTDDVDDAVFPQAFSDALDAFEDVEAPAIADAVHSGITDACSRALFDEDELCPRRCSGGCPECTD